MVRSFVSDDPTPVDDTRPTVLICPDKIETLRLIEARAAGIAQGKKESRRRGRDFEVGLLVGYLIAIASVLTGILVGYWFV
jgi:hypothetical protein